MCIRDRGYNNLAILSKRKKDHRRAIMLLDSALIYADAAKDLSSRSMIHYQLAENYEALGNYRNAYEQANLRLSLIHI